jgi:Flp pilus assembly protein TadD
MDAQLNNGPAPRSPWSDPWLWIVGGVALALRLLYLVDLTAIPFFAEPQMDAGYHDAWARRLAAGEGSDPSVYFRAPLYPFFLAALYRLGADYLGVRVVQFMIGTATALLTTALVYRRLGRRVALVAGLLVAVHGPLIYFEGELLLVVLEAPLYLLSAWATDRALRRRSPRSWVLAGALAGAASLVRPIFLAFLPVLGIHLLWRRRRSGIVPGAAYALGLLVVVSPVLVRNAVVGKDLVPIASQGGLNYFLGNNPQADGMSAVAPEFRRTWEGGVQDARTLAERAEEKPLRPSQVSSYWFGRAMSWARNEPADFLVHQLQKLAYFWDPFEIPNNQDYYFFSRLTRLFRWLVLSGFGLLGPLALAGLAFGLFRRRIPFAWTAVPLTLMVVIVAFFVCAKFRAPMVPLLAVWAGTGLGLLWEAWRKREMRSLLVYAAGVTVLAVGLNADPWGLRSRHTPAESHLRLGIFHADRGEPARAEEHYRQAIAAKPGFADGWNNLGVLHAQAGNLRRARSAFSSALNAQPRHPRALGNLAALAFEEGRRAEADSLARRTLTVAGRAPDALYNAAVILGNLGDAATARLAFRELVRLEPDNARARIGEAKALLVLGRPAEARQVLLAHPAADRPPELDALLREIDAP